MIVVRLADIILIPSEAKMKYLFPITRISYRLGKAMRENHCPLMYLSSNLTQQIGPTSFRLKAGWHSYHDV